MCISECIGQAATFTIGIKKKLETKSLIRTKAEHQDQHRHTHTSIDMTEPYPESRVRERKREREDMEKMYPVEYDNGYIEGKKPLFDGFFGKC